MKKQDGILGLLVVLMLIAGCTTLTAEGENVRVTNDPNRVRDCKLKGNIQSTSVSESDAIVQTQNAAARLHGNVVLVNAGHAPRGEGALIDMLSTEVLSKAYWCE